MNFKKIVVGALSLVMALSLLVGCGSESTVSTDGEIVINLGTEPSKLNSVLATGSVDGNVLRHVMVGLVSLDATDSAVPGIAESWEWSNNDTTLTFKLRDNAVWSNGEKVTAYDFEYAWDQQFTRDNAASYSDTWAVYFKGAEAMLKAKDDAAWQAAKAEEGYKAVDETTFVLNLTMPCKYIVELMTFQSFFPVNEKAVEAAGGLDNYATEADNIVTNGPFKMTKWEHDNEIVLERNEDFYNADSIKLAKITMRMITDSNTVMNEYVAGNLDLAGFSGDQVTQLKDQGVEVLNYSDGSCFYLEFNTSLPGLNNAKVRQALAIGANAQGFVDNVLKNSSTAALSYTPESIKGGEFSTAVGNLIDRPTNGDYSAAKALLEEGLAEEGLTLDTFKVTMIGDDGDTVTTMCAFIQEQLRVNLGVTMEINQMPYKSRLEAMKNKNFSIVFAGWGPDYNDPMTFLDLWVSTGRNNHTSWANKEFDALIQAAYAETDADARTDILIQAEKLLIEEMPIAPMYHRKRDYAVSTRLKGALRTAFQDLNLVNAYVE